MIRSLSRNAPFGLGALYVLLALPAVRTLLEGSMSAHMLVQIPLLAAIGILACRLLPARWQGALLAAVGGAIPCVLLAIFASSYWMLPRALDAALANPLAEAAKFASLPVLVGLPLALAWKELSTIGRNFIWTNFISMLAVLGWLYIVAPQRVCNNYLVDQQAGAGWLMVKLAVLLFAGWLATLFVGGDPAIQGRDDAEADDERADDSSGSLLGCAVPLMALFPEEASRSRHNVAPTRITIQVRARDERKSRSE